MSLDTPLEKLPGQIQRGGIVDEEAQRNLESAEDPKRKDEVEESDSPSVDSEGSGIPIEKVDWDSPDDPGNPQLWPMWKKVFHTAIPALYGFTV
jgi:hypothetical protein